MGNPAEPVLTHFSAVTSLGINSHESAMCFRAGSVGLRECPILDQEENSVTFCNVPILEPWLLGTERMQALVEMCLTDLLGSARALAYQRVKVILLLDEDQGDPDPQGVVPAEKLGLFVRQKVREATQTNAALEVDVTGGAGFGDAVNRLSQGLSEGYFEFGLIVTAHSDYSIERIGHLSRNNRLHKPEQLDGVIPGEAAVALVLCQAPTARASGLTPACRVSPAAVTVEKARWDNEHPSFEAAGLTVAARRATEAHQQAGRPIGWVQSDVSAETFRLQELQTVMARIQRRLGPPQLLDFPCQRMGELGATVAAWQVAYAAEAFMRGFAPAPEVLCMAGSEGGARTAFVVSEPLR